MPTIWKVVIAVGVACAIGCLVVTIRKGVAAPSQYSNLEQWSVQYNEDGLPTVIEIHRDAKQVGMLR